MKARARMAGLRRRAYAPAPAPAMTAIPRRPRRDPGRRFQPRGAGDDAPMAAGDLISIGRDTRERMLWAEACPALAEVGILALGVSDAADGYSLERPDPRKGVLIASLAGRGW